MDKRKKTYRIAVRASVDLGRRIESVRAGLTTEAGAPTDTAVVLMLLDLGITAYEGKQRKQPRKKEH